ncbi:hypothetical protein BDZ91DRAFT_767005 [Kalaharituber pfeilii]|nr:hypothetical protein BDZ91DRAFT_767005 [Kalaharituber pfeilii]
MVVMGQVYGQGINSVCNCKPTLMLTEWRYNGLKSGIRQKFSDTLLWLEQSRDEEECGGTTSLEQNMIKLFPSARLLGYPVRADGSISHMGPKAASGQRDGNHLRQTRKQVEASRWLLLGMTIGTVVDDVVKNVMIAYLIPNNTIITSNDVFNLMTSPLMPVWIFLMEVASRDDPKIPFTHPGEPLACILESPQVGQGLEPREIGILLEALLWRNPPNGKSSYVGEGTSFWENSVRIQLYVCFCLEFAWSETTLLCRWLNTFVQPVLQVPEPQNGTKSHSPGHEQHT